MPEKVIQIECPSCQRILFLALTLTRATNQDGQRFEVTCPLCSSEFPIGWITDFRIKTPEPSLVLSPEVQEAPVEVTSLSSPAKGFEETERSSDDDGNHEWAGGRSPNDDRSDSMNPNNPANQAATDNRSNQLNSNNPAYHSSRGQGRH